MRKLSDDNISWAFCEYEHISTLKYNTSTLGIKPTDLCQIWHLNLHLNQNQKNHKERLQNEIILDISNHQDDAIVIIYKFAGVILKGWARRSIRLVVIRIKMG